MLDEKIEIAIRNFAQNKDQKSFQELRSAIRQSKPMGTDVGDRNYIDVGSTRFELPEAMELLNVLEAQWQETSGGDFSKNKIETSGYFDPAIH